MYIYIHLFIYFELIINSDIEDASDHCGSGTMCCIFTAAAHVFLSSLHLFFSVCTPQAAAQ